jgi:tetratricopeptide (TPR) repeat protein
LKIVRDDDNPTAANPSWGHSAGKKTLDSAGMTSRRQKAGLLFLGIFLAFILLETGLRVGGFVLLALQDYKNKIALSHKDNFRILCIGESTTQDQYPRFLREIFKSRKLGKEIDVIDKGLSGTNSSVILRQLPALLDKYRPDLVIAMMGINDQGRAIPYEISSDSGMHLSSLRTYKLFRLLWRHLLAKLEEVGIIQLHEKWPRFARGDYFKWNPVEYFQEEFSWPQRFIEKDRSKVGAGKNAQGQGGLPSPFIMEMPAWISLEDEANDAESSEDLVRLYREKMAAYSKEISFKKVMKDDPNDDKVYVETGRFYYQQGRLAEAENCFLRAVEIAPQELATYFDLERVYYFQEKFSKAEKVLRKIIEMNPNNAVAYHRLGQIYRDQGRLAEAERYYRKSLEIDPKDYDVYIELGSVCIDKGEYEKAEEAYLKAAEIHPEKDEPYFLLGLMARESNDPEKEERFLRKAVEINPRGVALTYFVYIYKTPERFKEAETILYKAIEADPHNDAAYYLLGIFFYQKDQFEQAERFFLKAEELNPRNRSPYPWLALTYLRQEKFAQAEALLENVIESHPEDIKSLGVLATVYASQGKKELADYYFNKINQTRDAVYLPKTVQNYRHLKEILDRRKIPLVCAQYPMRSVVPLKKIFGGEDAKIIFVDNEKLFKDAVGKEGYPAYFTDYYGGDFGHCTEKGNRLLAENIADTIIREYFHK